MDMFFRLMNGKNKTYLYAVEGYRDDNNKVKQRIIHKLGPLEELADSLRTIVMKLPKGKKNVAILKPEISRIEMRYNYGCMRIINKLWNELKIEELIKDISKERKIRYDITESIKLMIANRFVKPNSKLKLYNNQGYYKTNEEVELHNLYRTLDILAENKEKIEKRLYEARQEVVKEELDIVFYDVTTIYFESVIEDGFRKYGYSKDLKINNTQIVMSLAVDKREVPISINIFEGNTYEGKTLIDCLERMKEGYKIKQVIIVADRGINSKCNLDLLRKYGYEYIVGTRIKNLTKELQEKILDRKGYEVAEPEKYEYRIINNGTERIICTWSNKRAKKDRQDRERLINKARGIVEEGKIPNHMGASKYIKTKVEGKPVLDEEKIKEDMKWDGLYGVQTNNKDKSWEELIGGYHQLWKIEDAFRSMKDHLEIRPIFHYTKSRIVGHIVMNYMTYFMEKILQTKVSKAVNKNVSLNEIREAIEEMEVDIIKTGNDKVTVEGQLTNLAQTILKVV